MKRISICALKKDRKPILELLQRCGAVEVDSILPEDSVFSHADTSANRSVFQKNITAAESALEILGQYVPERKTDVRFVRRPRMEKPAGITIYLPKNTMRSWKSFIRSQRCPAPLRKTNRE